MMIVNTSDLKADITKLNNLIDKYEDIYLNLYNELNKSSFFWQDNKSKLFYDNANLEKLKIITTTNELRLLNDIYVYVHDSYVELGKIIEFDLKMKDKILSSFNICNEKLKNAIRNNNSVDVGFASEISSNIRDNIGNLSKMQSSLQDFKTIVKDSFNKIEEIEKEVKHKISNLKLEYIKESDITNYI